MKRFLLFVCLLIVFSCNAQTFQQVYDYDSTDDWGWDILLKPNGDYFIVGDAQPNGGSDRVMNMSITADGNTTYNKHLFPAFQWNDYPANPGTAKALSTGGYIAPITIQLFPPWGGWLRSFAGLIKFNNTGDTVWRKTYTDTSYQFDYAFDCVATSDGGYLLGAVRTGNPDSFGYIPWNHPMMLIKTDGNGNKIWERLYKLDTGQASTLNRLDTLSGGRILVGAMSTYDVTNYGYTYAHNRPWFLILDSIGNILKDTAYGPRYGGGGWISRDVNGGFFQGGCIDSFINPNLTWGNFPNYIAHLDTNFRLDWIQMFNYSEFYQYRTFANIRQTVDGSYVIAGDIGSNYTGWAKAWGAKVSKTGHLLWSHAYSSDTLADSYFRDVAIRPDGSIVFCGAASNDTLPPSHSFQDVWLVSVDSNGCLQPGCSPDTTDPDLIIVPLKHSQPAFSVYPNPVTGGSFTVQSSSAGKVYVVDMQGRRIAAYQASAGQTHLRLPQGILSGTYICVLQPDDGSGEEVVHLLYE